MGFDFLEVDGVALAGQGEEKVVNHEEEGLMLMLGEAVWGLDCLLNEVEANEAVSEEVMGARVPMPVEMWRYSLVYVE